MKLKLSLAIFCSFVLLVPAVVAQVPQLINYQGRVIVGTTNFDGAGEFKFALVNAAGTAAYWTNDGTHLDGTEPTDAVTLTVSNGLYSVLLGDTSLTHMIAIPNALFNNPDIRLRVWFNNQTNGSQQLAPDQRIASAGYTVVADNVSDGAITSEKFAPGAVGLTNLTSDAVVGNLAQSGQNVVAPAGVILSSADNSALVAAGYVKLATTTIRDGWQHRGSNGAPFAGYCPAVWTGSEMIIWGGGNAHNTGGRYNPASNSWTATTTTGAPVGRYSHTLVWTGTEMIIWGGVGADGNGVVLKSGGRYNPASDSWIATATTGAPAARSDHTAVWTGSQMIVWGGDDSVSTNFLNTGSRYSPASNTWAATTTTGAPGFREGHSAVWTGSVMIIWGGSGPIFYSDPLNTGGRYNPASNAWAATTATGAPAARFGNSAVWTGSEMIVWGGVDTNFNALGSGGRYNPVANSWATTTATAAPSARNGHVGLWAGSEMIIWGGAAGTYVNTGALYDPASNSWHAMTNTGVPSPRAGNVAVWTGNDMLIWGGADDNTNFNETFSYNPQKTMVLYQKLGP